MKRINQLKKIIKNNTYQNFDFKKTDVETIYNLYAYFLEKEDYAANKIIHKIFCEGKFIYQLFGKIEIGEFQEGIENFLTEDESGETIDLKQIPTLPRNWSQILSKLDRMVLSHLKKIIFEDSIDTFAHALTIWDDTNQFIGGTDLGREVRLECLYALPEILNEHGKDEWILLILIKQQNTKLLMKVIKNNLLESEPSILKKALFISTEMKLAEANLYDDLRFRVSEDLFANEINIIMQKEMFNCVPQFLTKINYPYVSNAVYYVLRSIYEIDKEIFLQSIKTFERRKRSNVYIKLNSLRFIILEDQFSDLKFLIQDIILYIEKNYNNNVFKDIKKYKDPSKSSISIKRVHELHYKEELYYDVISLLSIASLKFSIDFDFSQVLHDSFLNFEKVITCILAELTKYNSDKELKGKVYEHFLSLINDELITSDMALSLAKKSITSIMNSENIFHCEKYFGPFIKTISNVICKEIDGKESLQQVWDAVYYNSFPHIIRNTEPHSFIECLSKREGYYYIQALFWVCFQNFHHLRVKKTNINDVLNVIFFCICNYIMKFGESNLVMEVKQDPIKNLITLKDMMSKFINISIDEEGNNQVNAVISELISTMLEYFQDDQEKERIEAIAQARIEERNRIMANLSHTVKTMLSNIINPLQNMKESGNFKEIKIDNALRGAELIKSLVNAMNMSFKGSIEDFIYDVQNNTYDNCSSLEEMFMESLKQAISITFDGKYFKEFLDNYYPSKARFLEVKQKWNDVSQLSDSEQIITFANKYLFETDIDFSDAKEYIIGNEKGSSLKLLILIQEVIMNAVKYSSFVSKNSRKINIKFSANEEGISIFVSNTFKQNVQVKSSGLGQEIIKNFSSLLQTKPIITLKDNLYSVEIKFRNIWRRE